MSFREYYLWQGFILDVFLQVTVRRLTNNCIFSPKLPKLRETVLAR